MLSARCSSVWSSQLSSMQHSIGAESVEYEFELIEQIIAPIEQHNRDLNHQHSMSKQKSCAYSKRCWIRYSKSDSSYKTVTRPNRGKNRKSKEIIMHLLLHNIREKWYIIPTKRKHCSTPAHACCMNNTVNIQLQHTIVCTWFSKIACAHMHTVVTQAATEATKERNHVRSVCIIGHVDGGTEVTATI